MSSKKKVLKVLSAAVIFQAMMQDASQAKLPAIEDTTSGDDAKTSDIENTKPNASTILAKMYDYQGVIENSDDQVLFGAYTFSNWGV